MFDINKDTMVIYQIENKINHKKYIGYTTHTVKDRWKTHCGTAFNKSSKDYNEIFKRAIRKYGKDGFILSVLEQCETIEQLKEREQYWIKEKNTFIYDKDSWGYNSTRGGDGAHGYGCKPVSQFDIISGKLIKKYESIHQATALNCRGVFESCSNPTLERSVNNTCFFFTKDVENLSEEEIIDKVHSRYPCLIYQLDLQGNFIKLWRTAKEPAEQYGYSIGNIIMACLGRRRLANGYQWVYQRDIKERMGKPVRDIKKNTQRVIQYSLGGEKIKEWNSLREAAITLNLQDSKISSCCRGNRKKTGNFQWRYAEDKLDKLASLPIKPKVICVETQEIFDTINQAAKSYGVAFTTMKKVCEGGNSNKLIYHFNYYYDD